MESSHLFQKRCFIRIKDFYQPGSAGRTLPPPEGSEDKPEKVGKDRGEIEKQAPKTLSRHGRALGGRRT